MPSAEQLTQVAAIITALGVFLAILVRAVTRLGKTFIDLRKEVLATRAETTATKDHVAMVSNQVAEGQTKLEKIDAKTSKTLENTNGSLSRVIEHAEALQAELERLRQRDELRSERERVMDRMLSEMTTTLAASQGALAKTGLSAPGGRRADDRDIDARVERGGEPR